MDYIRKRLLYQNALSKQDDIKGFILEGEAGITFDNGAMRMQNALDKGLGQKANFVLWCPQDFPPDIEISWSFSPVREPGLCILFFAAKGAGGEDLFSEKLGKRNGVYDQYHSGDINCYHISYFRRMWETERCFHTCNLRKSAGFHLTAQGADPLPDARDSKGFYEIRIARRGPDMAFYIEELPIFCWHDDGVEYGPVLGGGKIGFRQMAPLIGEYKDLRVYEIE